MANTDTKNSPARGITRRALVFIGVLALAGLAYAIARVDILRARIVTQEINLEAVQHDNLALRSRVEALVISNQDSATQLSQLRSELGALSDNFGEIHNRAEQAQRISQRSEALYLLRLANNQLQLAHDLDGAIDTLAAAETILRDTGEAAIDAVHQQVLAQLSQLRALPHGDVARIRQQLAAAEQQAGSLRLAGIAAAPDAKLQTVGFARAWVLLKRGLTSLFVVRKTGVEASSLLSAQEQTSRRRHLQMLLLNAAQSTHLHDQQGYVSALNDCSNWLDQAFDLADPRVSALHEQLSSLVQQNIAPTLPDLGPSVQALARLAPSTMANSP
jgi:uroporphyrin-III C-methyltransferase